MEAVLDISNIPEHLREFIPQFANAVLNSMRTKLKSRIPPERLKIYGEEIKNQRFISWILFPYSVDYDRLIKILCESIIYTDLDGKLIFKPNNHKNFPGTKTNMEVIFKFLSYGNGELGGIHQIQDIFNEYNKELKNMWMDFIVQIFEKEQEE